MSLRRRSIELVLRSCQPLAAGLLALGTPGCGGGGGTGPTPPASHTVVATVFYDENANGLLDAGEVGRVPAVELELAGRTATSEKLSGRAVLSGVPAGTHRLNVRAASAPAFYQAPASGTTVTVPQPAGSEAPLPLTLPIGANAPAVYMAFGDSITAGDGSAQHEGYRSVLQGLLRQHFGAGTVRDESLSGAKTDTGAENIGASLDRARPAYTLILFGTNDWQRQDCREAPPCFTADALRSIIGAAKAARSLPVLSTIPPVHPELGQPGRNEWVDRMNEFIRPLARQEGAALADVHAAIKRLPDFGQLFADRVHPNDRGYEVVAGEFFAAITRPLATTSGSLAATPASLTLLSPRGPAGPAAEAAR